jgi:hypothetical protein
MRVTAQRTAGEWTVRDVVAAGSPHATAFLLPVDADAALYLWSEAPEGAVVLVRPVSWLARVGPSASGE